MELSGTKRVDRAGRVVRTGPEQPRKEGASGPRPGEAQDRTDRLALSRQLVAFLDEQDRQAQEAARRDAQLSALSQKKKDLDLLDKQLKAMSACQKIAARIMAGDKVPPEDLRYLEENDPAGYKLALALRKPKKHPKEWETALEEEQPRQSDAPQGSEETAEGPGAVEASGEASGEASSSGGSTP